MKSKRLLVAGLITGGLMSLARATLNISTSIQNAVVYVKTIFLTQDGTPESETTLILSGEVGSIWTKGDLNTSGSVTIDESLNVSGDVNLAPGTID